MSTKQRELLHSQTNVEDQNKENSSTEELIHREEITGTPYLIIGNEEKKYRLVFSKWAMSDQMETVQEVRHYFHENMVNIILTTVLCIVDPKGESLNRMKN